MGETRRTSAADEWTSYLDSYHASHPGITERVLTRATNPTAGTPYGWLRAAVLANPGSVLDLACGSAPMHPWLPDASHYLGVDLSAAELAYAAERGRGPLMKANALSLPLPSASVDVVVCSMALMLLRPIEVALAEVARVLRSGGLFATIRPANTPFRLGDLRLVVPLLLGLKHLPEMPQRLSGHQLRRLLDEAGLDICSDEARRFVHPLESEDDARLALDALYLPHVGDDRRREAAARLSQHARPGSELPLAIRRTVAVRR
jgi:SAM-dependent methyltransferase